MKTILTSIMLLATMSQADMCQYHLDELSKGMQKVKLYAQNNMITETKLALKSAKRHNIEALAECGGEKKQEALRNSLRVLNTLITIDGKPI